MFPTIYEITVGYLSEEQAKLGSADLLMAIVGSALLPKLQGAIIDIGSRGVNDILIIGVSELNFSFLLPLICFSYITMYGCKVGR
ncbi:MAG: hypothetical protein CMC82_01435 [Flavobacteriaceae bacterium]|nr:hypothetical protein [Flavobacteriaceae bacterium]